MVIYMPMSEPDTICAVSTPPGDGGIGIIRVSGSNAVEIASRLFRSAKDGDLGSATTHTVRYGHIIDPASDATVDEVLVSVMRGPATYTREDVVEINCHGGMAPLMRTMALLLGNGARQAEPGEFTKRAFLNGRIDLAQAEAVMDIIRARTELSLRAANEQLQGGLSREIGSLRERLTGILAGVEAGVDFPEEEIETPSGRPLAEDIRAVIDGIDILLEGVVRGKVLRDGVATAIVGRPNVGKSSLLNALLMQARAIVNEAPGTTRDIIEECLNIGGVLFKINDTAGIRETHDMVEQEGVRRSLQAIASADIVIVVLDGSGELHEGDQRVLQEAQGKQAIAVINKSDLPRKLGRIEWPEAQVELSCTTGAGLGRLREKMLAIMQKGALLPREHAWAVNRRHRTALERSRASLERARLAAEKGLSPELIALDLRDALDSIGLIIGASHTEDILERIFRDFCIGK